MIRRASADDAPELCALLNEIIAVGGTTAIETPLTNEDFTNHFLQGVDHLCCFVAIDKFGALAGFQSLERRNRLPDGWGDIATFARLKPKTPGVGSALIKETLLYAAQLGVIAINATIRADNTGGLAYYHKMGFETYTVDKDVPLADGRKIDRISKRIWVR